ncbi:MAG TPA: SAVED domain-containing protein [Terriglobales bacterium]|nr:SAVED domain-containing protein [Terriglobales bacterium]
MAYDISNFNWYNFWVLDHWCWKDEAGPTAFTIAAEHRGQASEVAVLLSVSGKIDRNALPAETSELPLYELTVANGSPCRTRINTRADLERFRVAYQELLGRIRRDHPGAEAVHLFAAVPAPVAVTCGREVLRKIDPVIHVYDFEKVASRYVYALKVNEK